MITTYQDLLAWGRGQLAGAGVPEANLDAWYLFSEAFGISRAVYFLDQTRPLDISQDSFRKKVEQFRQWIDRRKERIPLQYILGSQEFMGYVFQVNKHVLIPRQDTEILVEEILTDCKRKKSRGLSVLDMCTGSGCIAISLKLLGNDCFSKVLAVDLSEEALLTAGDNAKRLGAEITFLHSDLFLNVPRESVDILVSNPPYIPKKTIDTLMPEVRDHEPRMALEASDNGLYFYRQLAREGFDYVKPGGWIYVEIGFDQAEAVSNIFWDNGFAQIQVKKDLAGLDRVVKACRPKSVSAVCSF